MATQEDPREWEKFRSKDEWPSLRLANNFICSRCKKRGIYSEQNWGDVFPHIILTLTHSQGSPLKVRVSVKQLRIERHLSVQKLFLGMLGERNHRRQCKKLLSVSLVSTKPPAMLPCKNLLTQYLFLYVYSWESPISVLWAAWTQKLLTSFIC